MGGARHGRAHAAGDHGVGLGVLGLQGPAQRGRLIVYEAIIDDERRSNAFGLLMSLNMLIETRGGFDFTGADCIGWMKQVGFREARVEHLVGPDSMVIGTK